METILSNISENNYFVWNYRPYMSNLRQKKSPLPNCVGKNGMYYDPEHQNTLERNRKPW